MKEALFEKIKYLLAYKLKTEDLRYQRLLEQLFFEFIENADKLYNNGNIATASFYNLLLNKLNKNVKTIIIPSTHFKYSSSNFLEFGTNLKNQLIKYQEENIPITKELKEEVLKKKYFQYILQVMKNNENALGFLFPNNRSWLELERSLNEYQALTLSSRKKNYRKDYKIMYPDGTTYHYFVYTKAFDVAEVLNMNAIAMIEIIFGKEQLFFSDLQSNTGILKNFDKEYSHLLGELMYDEHGHVAYIPTTIINEFLKRIRKEENAFKKIEYFKKLNCFLLELFDYKVTSTLNQKDEEQIKKLSIDMKKMETCLLYNANYELNSTMTHIKLFKMIRNKMENYQKQDRTKVEKEYTIYSTDKKKKEVVISSVQPIQIDNKYILIQVLDVYSMNNRVLIKTNLNVLDSASLASKVYTDIYISLKELKHLYSSSDLGIATRESEVIRNAIANRAFNPTIMDIIKKERHNFLGEFIYSATDDRCIIYKNKSIEKVLENGI